MYLFFFLLHFEIEFIIYCAVRLLSTFYVPYRFLSVMYIWPNIAEHIDLQDKRFQTNKKCSFHLFVSLSFENI